MRTLIWSSDHKTGHDAAICAFDHPIAKPCPGRNGDSSGYLSKAIRSDSVVSDNTRLNPSRHSPRLRDIHACTVSESWTKCIFYLSRGPPLPQFAPVAYDGNDYLDSEYPPLNNGETTEYKKEIVTEGQTGSRATDSDNLITGGQRILSVDSMEVCRGLS